MARIEDLKGIVSGRGGFANPTLYRIELPALPGAGVSTRDFSLLCKSVSIPGRQIATLPLEIGVQKQFVAMNHEVPPVQLVFRILNDYAIKNYFEYWQNLMVNKESFEIGYDNEYSKTVKRIIAQIRILKHKSFIIWGGIHAIVHPEDAIKYADAVCTGEGEFSFQKLLLH